MDISPHHVSTALYETYRNLPRSYVDMVVADVSAIVVETNFRLYLTKDSYFEKQGRKLSFHFTSRTGSRWEVFVDGVNATDNIASFVTYSLGVKHGIQP